MNITQKIIESKYYQSEYETLNKEFNYIIEDSYIIDKQDQSKKIKILFDEICYNRDYKSYRLFCIDYPLVGGTGIKPSTSQDGDLDYQGIPKPQKPTYDQACQFLLFGSSFSPNSIVMGKADRQIEQIIDSQYRLIKGSEKDLYNKVQRIHEKTLDDLVCANAEYKQLQTNEKQMSNLSLLLENYLIGKLNEVIYQELKVTYREENIALYEKMISLSKQSLEDIGIRKEFEPHLSKAIETMLYYSTEPSNPFDKLLTVIQASNEIEESIKATSILEAIDDQMLTITGDDALPLTAYLLIQSRPKYLESDLIYCTNFIFTNILNSSFGYYLVNFQAAIDYIKSISIKNGNGDESNNSNGSSNENNHTSYYSTDYNEYSIKENNNINNSNNNLINNNTYPTIPSYLTTGSIYQPSFNQPSFRKSISVSTFDHGSDYSSNTNHINSNTTSRSSHFSPLTKNYSSSSSSTTSPTNNNSIYTSSPNLLNHFNSLSTSGGGGTKKSNYPDTSSKYNTISSSTFSRNNTTSSTSSTSTQNNTFQYKEYTKAPTVIRLDDDDDNDLGDFIGRLKDMKDDVIVASQFK
eukprot:gene3292-4124_t